MSSNKKAKQAFIKLYGAECFIEKLHLRDTSQLEYTGKKQYKRMKMLTYHHILMRSKGGKATVKNGALLSAENHIWFHQQNRIVQEQINEMFQEYKRNVDSGASDECQIVITEDIPQTVEVRTATFNPRELEYNRAKTKAKTRMAVSKYYEGENR